MNKLKRPGRSSMDRRVLLAGLGGVMAGTLVSSKATAGILEPPGPPSPTGVSLEAVAARSSRTDVGCANPGQDPAWGPSGTREKPTGLAIVNLRTREMVIAGQTKEGSGLWHVSGSPDGRWAVGDDFSRSIYLIDRRTSEMIMLSTGHKTTAADHPHPTMSPDGTRIEIQSAMLSLDGRSMNICIIPVPEAWLKRK